MIKPLYSPQKNTKPVVRTVGSEKHLFLSDADAYAAVQEVYEDKLAANTAKTLNKEYRPIFPGVKGEDCGSELLKKIRVTEKAYTDAVYYAQEMCKEEPLELAMHMLRHEYAEPGLVTDIVPAFRQRVSAVNCLYEQFISTKYPSNRKYAGWCHSHANMDVFHSAADDNNVLNKLQEGGIWIPGTNISYIPSLVINAQGKTFGAIGIRENDKKEIKKVPVQIEETDISTTQYHFPKFRKENIRSSLEGMLKGKGKRKKYDTKFERAVREYRG